MKILFLYRTINADLSNTVIDFQYNTLKNSVDIIKYPIKSGKLKGYLKELPSIIRTIKSEKIDLVHAHYSFSGFLAGINFRVPTICSLMGSDLINQPKNFVLLAKFFSHYVWKFTIVKSREMHKLLPNSLIIPNGVDFDNFRPVDKNYARKRIGFRNNKKNIIFVAANIHDPIKNFGLAKKSFELIKSSEVELHPISQISYHELPYYYNAADLLLLTSLWEGSPNVIKEALACNCPVVATNVGDVKEQIANIKGCYITSFEPKDIANKIDQVIASSENFESRSLITHLNSIIINKKIIELYEKTLK